MTAYGFAKKSRCYTYEKDFMDGDFHAVVTVSQKGEVSGTVIDRMNGDQTTVDIVNLKIDPERGAALRAQPGIYPGYHMNHKNWISVVLDGTIADDVVMASVADSYRLTKKK